MSIEKAILQIIRGERQVPGVLPCLATLSALYRLALSFRNWAYDRGLFSSEKLPVPVISVGNVTFGGTGKTPLVHLLANLLQEKARLAILTRGYRSQIEKSGALKQISTGEGPLFSPEECGDEPWFLAQKTKASIWVGADRVSSGKRAIAEGANCLLLDDGMQHRRLKRDFEIVVVDGTDPFSQGRFLPRGALRDSPKRLKNAGLIVATHVEDEAHFAQIQKQVSRFSGAPLIGTCTEVVGKEKFSPRKVGVFCGIGQPTHFLQTVRDLNQEIVDTLILNDHEALQSGPLEHFAKQCVEKGAEALLCTEKDYVKLSLPNSLPIDVIPVAIALKITFGKEHWEQYIGNMKDLL